MDITLWIDVMIFIVLMVLCGFFSGSESSLFSLGKVQLEQKRIDGNPKLDLVERLPSRPRRGSSGKSGYSGRQFGS